MRDKGPGIARGAQAILRCVVAALWLAILSSGCGPSRAERQAAWVEAFQVDLDTTHERWQADVDRKLFRDNVEALRELNARYEQVYARWSERVDPLSQAILSYTVALGSRVDRGEISREDAQRIHEKLKAGIAVGRQAAIKDASQAERDAAMLQWWEVFWSQQRETYQVTPGNPINCRVAADEARGNLVQCD
jgi:hypothetical protein